MSKTAPKVQRTQRTQPRHEDTHAPRRRTGRGRLATALVGAISVAVLLASCGTVPGAAVDVDGTQVSTSAMLDRVTEVLGASDTSDASAGAATDDSTRAQMARAQITDVVRHELVQRAAKRAGITVGAKDVNDYLAQYDTYQTSSGAPDLADVLQVPSADVKNAVYDLLVLDELIKKVPSAGADVTDISVTVTAVPAATWAEAVADRVKYTADPTAMDAAAAAALAANANLPSGQETLLQQPQHAAFGIFSAADGEILIIPQGSQGYLVTRITDRTEKPAKLTADMITGVYQTAGLSGEIAVASLLLDKDAAAANVEVNPRFGAWDPQVVQVVASSSSS